MLLDYLILFDIKVHLLKKIITKFFKSDLLYKSFKTFPSSIVIIQESCVNFC